MSPHKLPTITAHALILAVVTLSAMACTPLAQQSAVKGVATGIACGMDLAAGLGDEPAVSDVLLAVGCGLERWGHEPMADGFEKLADAADALEAAGRDLADNPRNSEAKASAVEALSHCESVATESGK